MSLSNIIRKFAPSRQQVVYIRSDNRRKTRVLSYQAIWRHPDSVNKPILKPVEHLVWSISHLH